MVVNGYSLNGIILEHFVSPVQLDRADESVSNETMYVTQCMYSTAKVTTMKYQWVRNATTSKGIRKEMGMRD